MECEFCKKVLSSKTALKYHQKNTKKCLKLQNKEIDEYICIFCRKCFTNKICLTRHLDICEIKQEKDIQKITEDLQKLVIENTELKAQNEQLKLQTKEIEDLRYELEDKIDFSNNLYTTVKELTAKLKYDEIEIKNYIKTIDELKLKIEKYENNLFEIANKPRFATTNKNIYNNFIENLIPIVDEDFVNLSNQLTKEHILNYSKGLCDLVLPFLKERAYCSDLSRQIVKYKDRTGELITDPKLNIFMMKFFYSIQNEYEKISNQVIKDIMEDTEKTKLEKDLVIIKIKTHNSSVFQGGRGVENDLANFLIKTSMSVLYSNKPN